MNQVLEQYQGFRSSDWSQGEQWKFDFLEAYQKELEEYEENNLAVSEVRELIEFLSQTRDGYVIPAFIMGQRFGSETWEEFSDRVNSTEQAAETVSNLLDESIDLDERLTEFYEQFGDIESASGGPLLTLATFLIGYTYPEKHVIYRHDFVIDPINDLFKNANISKNQGFDIDVYHQVRDFSSEVRDKLEGLFDDVTYVDVWDFYYFYQVYKLPEDVRADLEGFLERARSSYTRIFALKCFFEYGENPVFQKELEEFIRDEAEEKAPGDNPQVYSDVGTNAFSKSKIFYAEDNNYGLDNEFSEISGNIALYVDYLWGQAESSSVETVWIEKSYVSNREDRLEGDRRVGKALWSPQEKKDGSNSVYYDNLKRAESGDVVIHLDQNTREFIGVSKVKDTFNETKVLENTQWDNVGVNEMDYERGERPCYLVELEGYKEFENHIDVNKVFNEENSRLLNQLDEKYSGLVFNKNYNLNQGAYLTKTPKELVRLIEEAYNEENQGGLPYLNSFSISEEGNMAEIKDNPAEYEKEIEVYEELSAHLDLEFDDLYFPEDEEESIKNQIEASLNSGKHIIFTGPPGTGKTELAEKVAEEMEKKDENVTGHQLTTATSDWSTFDTVGGYRPEDDGSLEFKPGHILRRFKDDEKDLKNEALVIDEINRADIDKAFGQLFTVLSGQRVQLPFTKGEAEKEVEVVPGEGFEKPVQDHEFVVPESWRILATMNTYDKTSLYEMSYAFMRRFSFIRIEAPGLEDDYTELMKGYLDAWELDDLYSREDGEIILDELVEDVAEIWKSVNNAVEGREIGPAIAKDMIEFSNANDMSRKDANTAAITNFIFPQLEGVPDRKKIVESLLDEDLVVDENRLKSTAGSMLQVEFDGED